MGMESAIESIIKNQLMNLHTAFIGKVVSVNGNTAIVQPLSMIKAYGAAAKPQTAISVAVPKNVKHERKTITYLTGGSQSQTTEILIPSDISSGDIVYCGICERDITEARKGQIAQVSTRHHDINDGVILAVL